MCLIAVVWRPEADLPFVVAANRDEFLARPTAAADWSSDDATLSGRDLREGGTWMGATRGGRFAALTNHRDPMAFRPDAPTRGALVDRFLGAADADGALAAIARDGRQYNGFNLLAGTWRAPGSLTFVTDAGMVEPLAPGIRVLSNARLDRPWPKAVALREGIGRALRNEATGGGSRAADAFVEALFALLADRTIAPDAALPDTGVGLERERALSPALIRAPGYGTRSSTVFVVDRDDRALFVERTFDGDVVADRRFAFAATAAPA